MLKKILSFFKKNEKEKKEVDGLFFAKEVIDHVLSPQITREIDVANKFLADKKVRLGVEINWIIDKIE